MLEWTTVYIIDDCSKNTTTKNLIKDLNINGVKVVKQFNKENRGVWTCLKDAFDYFEENNFDIFCNLDSDVLLNKYWQVTLMKLYLKNKDKIITGFNAANSVRYDAGIEKPDYWIKERVCGVNLYFNRKLYKYVKKALEYQENWDLELPHIMKESKKKFICSKPSVVQHIGMQSSIGHRIFAEAIDFDNNIIIK